MSGAELPFVNTVTVRFPCLKTMSCAWHRFPFVKQKRGDRRQTGEEDAHGLRAPSSDAATLAGPGGAVVSHRGPLPSKCQGPIGEGFVVRGKGESVATRAATLSK